VIRLLWLHAGFQSALEHQQGSTKENQAANDINLDIAGIRVLRIDVDITEREIGGDQDRVDDMDDPVRGFEVRLDDVGLGHTSAEACHHLDR